jgi:hypothetical protein
MNQPQGNRRETTPRREPVTVPETVPARRAPARPAPARPANPPAPAKPQPATPGKKASSHHGVGETRR